MRKETKTTELASTDRKIQDCKLLPFLIEFFFGVEVICATRLRATWMVAYKNSKDITLETDADLGIASYEMHDELLGYSSSKIVDGTLMYVADGHVEMSVKLSGKTLRLTLERI